MCASVLPALMYVMYVMRLLAEVMTGAEPHSLYVLI